MLLFKTVASFLTLIFHKIPTAGSLMMLFADGSILVKNFETQCVVDTVTSIEQAFIQELTCEGYKSWKQGLTWRVKSKALRTRR